MQEGRVTVLELIQSLSGLGVEYMDWEVELEGCDCVGDSYCVAIEDDAVLITRSDGEWRRSRDLAPIRPPECTTPDTHDWQTTGESTRPGNMVYRCARCPATQVRGVE